MFPFFLLLVLATSRTPPPGASIEPLVRDFAREYRALDIPWVDFDYREYLGSIPALPVLDRRETVLLAYRQRLEAFDPDQLLPAEKITYAHLRYQIALHLERCALEKQYKSAGTATVPTDGLKHVPNSEALYRFYIRYATGVDISPEEIYAYGLSEIAGIQSHIREIRDRNGFASDSAGWQKQLNDSRFFITHRDSVAAGYTQIRETALAHLGTLFEQHPADVPDIGFMSWPNAGPYTPPGIYLSADENAYGKAVFQFNFYGGRHNRRAMDWLFLHEAIPGHHFHRYVRGQTVQDALEGLWFAGGTVEGWATYVEYFGEEMGLYRDDWAWLGKWEWDLVRSVRIVQSVGIHDRGWSKAEALAFWKANIPNQDDIAEREVTRCINWPAQVLTYKIGAKKIFELRKAAAQREGSAFDLKRFHTWLLSAGNIPLEVLAGK